jgi:tRNA pseudouridine38-40 synthase
VTLFEPSEIKPAAPKAPSVRVKLVVAYDGRGFKGFAAQPGQKTIGGSLGQALERALQAPVELTCAGRTDSGVHAWGQVVSFDAPVGTDLVALQRSVNKQLASSIVVRSAQMAPPDFDARRSATGRRYRYTVLNDPVPDPFLAGASWQVEAPLDLRAMQLACDPFLGSHDFAAFCRKPPEGSTTRFVQRAGWHRIDGRLLRFEIEANAFCHQMVRSVVGTLVEVGTGRRKAGDMAAVIRSGDRQQAGQLAPPHGLCLWEVVYHMA